VKPLAILKHISSKNANYGDAEKYLTFEHDEFTMKPTLDADGRLIPRVDYRISSLNCGGEDFAVACMRSNLRYGKNQKREDVKSHHYIISFQPFQSGKALLRGGVGCGNGSVQLVRGRKAILLVEHEGSRHLFEVVHGL
jgi:hypothetical protein